jgi:hypothetical protein
VPLGWLPNSSSNKNWIAGFVTSPAKDDLPQPARQLRSDRAARAREWQRLLESQVRFGLVLSSLAVKA